MFRTALKGIAANRLRFALTGISVILGVAFVAGSFVFTDTINARFENLFTDVYAGVDATVRPDGESIEVESIDESVLAAVAAVDGVDVAVGSVAGSAQLVSADGEPIGGQGPPTLGFSWVDTASLSALRVEDGNGRGPETADEIAIDVATAEANGFELGDSVDVQTVNGLDRFTIVGLASFGSEDNLAGATLSAFEFERAQELFDLDGQLSVIDVLAVDGVSQDELVAAIDPVLTDGLEAVTGEQSTQEALDDVTAGLGFLSTALLAFAGIAVFVGGFVIQNTFRITIAQRLRELALLRAVGATSGQVTRMVVLEATILGVVASALGVAVGVGVAWLLKVGMAAVGIGIPEGPLTVEARTVVIGMIVGIVVTVGSAILPARRAASIPPVAAMGEVHARTTRKSLRTRAFVGTGLTIAGAAGMGFGLVLENGSSLALVGMGATALFLGMSTLAPLVAAPVARVLAFCMRGITGKLAKENTVRQPRRTASTASALMVGVALVAFVGMFAASIRASVSETIETAFPADIAIQPSDFTAWLSATAVDELASADEVAVVSAVSAGYFEADGQEFNVVGVDPDTIERVYDPVASIDFADLGDGMIVQVDKLEERGWAVGQTVTVDFPGTGETTIEVVGTMEDSSFANYLISNELFQQVVDPDGLIIAFARFADGVSAEEGMAAAEAALVEFPTLNINTRSDQIAQAEAQIDQLLALFSGLLGLALVIALLGIANTLALSIVERTREIGLLRAVGMARRQVRTMVRREAIITATFGALLGVGIGSAIGFGVVGSLADDGLGVVAWPADQLTLWVVAAAIAGVVASVGPARKAAKLDVLEAISTE